MDERKFTGPLGGGIAKVWRQNSPGKRCTAKSRQTSIPFRSFRSQNLRSSFYERERRALRRRWTPPGRRTRRISRASVGGGGGRRSEHNGKPRRRPSPPLLAHRNARRARMRVIFNKQFPSRLVCVYRAIRVYLYLTVGPG